MKGALRCVTQERTPASEPPTDTRQESPSESANTLTVVWIHEGPVCVTIVDAPNHSAGSGVCHCPACHGVAEADLESHFLKLL